MHKTLYKNKSSSNICFNPWSFGIRDALLPNSKSFGIRDALLPNSKSFGIRDALLPNSKSFGIRDALLPNSKSFGIRDALLPNSKSFGIRDALLPNSKSFGHRYEKSVSASGLTPIGLSFSRFATSCKIVIISLNEILCIPIACVTPFFTDLIKDSTQPFHHGASAGEKIQSIPF